MCSSSNDRRNRHRRRYRNGGGAHHRHVECRRKQSAATRRFNPILQFLGRLFPFFLSRRTTCASRVSRGLHYTAYDRPKTGCRHRVRRRDSTARTRRNDDWSLSSCAASKRKREFVHGANNKPPAKPWRKRPANNDDAQAVRVTNRRGVLLGPRQVGARPEVSSLKTRTKTAAISDRRVDE